MGRKMVSKPDQTPLVLSGEHDHDVTPGAAAESARAASEMPRDRFAAKVRRILAANVRWRGELLRQTWLYGLAVLGPFVLLGLFAVGFRFSAFRPTGILVTPAGSPDAATVAHLPYVEGLNANINIRGITTNEQHALDLLQNGRVDMVIVLPRSPVTDVSHGQRATLSIYVSVVNPLLRIALYNAVNQQIAGVNDEAVAAAVGEVQDQTRDLLPQLDQLNSSMQGIHTTDPPAVVESKLLAIQAQLEEIRTRALAGQTAQRGTAADIYYAAIISETDQAISAISDAELQVRERRASVSSLASAQQSVKLLNDFLHQLNGIPARTVAIPFTARITNLAIGSDDLTNFYGPAALALLLQHLAITLAALSLVQERQLGAIETLSVSPTSAGELLLGRYIFYGLVTLATGVVLTLLLRFGLHVPFVGSPLLYLAILALLIWASTAAGFCLALVTRTDAQAMQSIMLLLVGAIFFSGFIGPLRALSVPVVGLAYIFPLTYGIDALDSIMLLGTAPPLLDFVGLAVLGTLLSLLALTLMRRELAPR
ncbi:MAG TPA: ABC transporter permease [Ktedonobacterales bacterium]